MSELYEKLKEKVKDMEINDTTLMTMLKYAMEIVETSSLKGIQQKEACLSMLTRVINESPLSASKKELYLKMVKSGVVFSAVDLIVDASKGNLNINQNYKEAVKTLTLCQSFFQVLGNLCSG
jgi:hypothetical protein